MGMSQPQHKELDAAPNPNKMPSGIPYIIGNEFAERFSYYGMKTILVIFMTKYLMDSAGNLAPMSDPEARVWFHMFSMANYFFPIVGAIVADVFWGKYKTIINLSLVYCLGHVFLALFETRFGLSIGLTLIAIGAGGIKPCVSAHVGDQFRPNQAHLLTKIFSWFYIAINMGAVISSLLTPLLLDRIGPTVAFGLPGVLMFIATFVFWLGRRKFVAIKPVGWTFYKSQLFSPQGKKAIINLIIIYAFISIFWSLFDQSGSSWVQQADKMNRNIDLRFWAFQFDFLQFELLPSQVQAINPGLILILTPLMAYIGYPFMNRFIRMTSLRRITIGMFLAGVSFIFCAIPEAHIAAGGTPHVSWQFVAYFFLTTSEIMVSITALEFAYTQAPNALKSFIMGFYMLSVALGNAVTAAVNFFIQNPDGSSKLEGAEYYWFFVGLMFVTAFIFMLISRFYQEEQYIQESLDPTKEAVHEEA